MNEGTSTQVQKIADNSHLSTKAKTALVVDDHPAMFKLVALYLRSLGHRVITASDGMEAQEIIMAHGAAGIDLLITDLDMPRMDGNELTHWFMQEKPNARVLMMSADGKRRKLVDGAAFIEKPFDLITLSARVQELLAV